jgi:prepilin-type N-terminal cleavage/methylation domain-containing protein
MAGSGKATAFKAGVTLIEVMVSLILFSTAIGMGSGMIKRGLAYPFIIDHAEGWINFMEEVNSVLQKLPEEVKLESIQTDTPPLNGVPLPRDLESWRINWKSSSLPNYKVAVFTAVNRQGKTLSWRIYLPCHEE